MQENPGSRHSADGERSKGARDHGRNGGSRDGGESGDRKGIRRAFGGGPGNGGPNTGGPGRAGYEQPRPGGPGDAEQPRPGGAGGRGAGPDGGRAASGPPGTGAHEDTGTYGDSRGPRRRPPIGKPGRPAAAPAHRPAASSGPPVAASAPGAVGTGAQAAPPFMAPGSTLGSRSARPPAPVAQRRARWLPPALILAGVALDLLITPAYTPSAVFAAVPLVAAPLMSARATAAYGVLSLCVLVLLLRFVGAPPYSESVTRVITVAVVSGLALGINYLVRRSDQQLASARGIAEAAQLAVLPTPPARLGPLDIAARYQAAQSDARIGGDLYAVQETPYGIRLIVGDVRGKGLGSVEAVAIVIGAFREAAEEEPTLEGVAGRLERALQREGGRRLGLDQFEGFTTAVLAEVPDGSPGLVRVVNRGHPSPLLFIGDTAVSLDPTVPALPLGLSELGEWPDRADEAAFPAGTQLLLYTDGLSEARDERGRFYNPAQRMRGQVFAGPDALLEAIVADVTEYTGGGSADDMALLAVVRRP